MKHCLLVPVLAWLSLALPAQADFQLVFTETNASELRICDIADVGCTINSLSPLADSPDLISPYATAVDSTNNLAYVVDDGAGTIRSVSTVTQNVVQDLFDVSQLESAIALNEEDQELYYIDISGGRDLKVISISDPTNPLTLTTSISQTEGAMRVAIDPKNRKFYFADVQSSGRSLKRRSYGDTTGDTEETVFTLNSGFGVFSIFPFPQNGKVYIGDFDDDAIYAVNIDGSSDISSITPIVSNAFNPDQLIIDPENQKIYWTQAVASTSPTNTMIKRADLDGSSIETLFATNTTPSITSVGGLGIIFDLPVLAPGTTIDLPPLLALDGNDVTFTFQDFSSASATSGLVSNSDVLPLLPAGTNTVRYEVEAEQGDGNTKSTYKAKVSKQNSTTIKNFPPGSWVVRYKAIVAQARTAEKVEQLTERFQGKLENANPNSKKAVRLGKVLLKLDNKFKRITQPTSPDTGFTIP